MPRDVILVVWFCVCTARTGKHGWAVGGIPGKGVAAPLCPEPAPASGDLETSSALVREGGEAWMGPSDLSALQQIKG